MSANEEASFTVQERQLMGLVKKRMPRERDKGRTKFKPTIRSKRCFLLFPVQGSERKGLVSVEVKKKKGQYDMKLLAVDIPMASGPDQRLYLIGDEEGYKVGGGLISELRDPVVKAMAATKEFDNLDRIEEEEDAARELQEAERKHREEIEKLEKESS
ncbi:hypothetical protein F2Q68_00023749 [Brassica cretica]|uniref:Uncharacterized protein n=1 Tax=Brassica cretica TaxID=69181 RepID=A0A8S9I9S7_BRACR|nr:hypothetical protein F2Q68_00023749 [Brassica cretica]